MHTSASDGANSPQEVVAEASVLGLKAIAITDHDVIEGVLPAQLAARKTGVEVIPGVEINTEAQEREIHILGYFVDVDDPRLVARLHELRKAREIRVEKIVNKLRQLGIEIELDRVLQIAGSGSVGRPHVGLAMIEKGYVASVAESFQKFTGFGRPAYVPRYKIDPQEAIKIINSVGGVAVYAHPGLALCDHLIPQMVRSGLRGLEVYYPEHTPEQQRYYLELARQYNLLVTGGSDYHGPGVNFRFNLGEVTVGYEVVDRLKSISQNHSPRFNHR